MVEMVFFSQYFSIFEVFTDPDGFLTVLHETTVIDMKRPIISWFRIFIYIRLNAVK
jgi:hypothetical protein